MVIFPSAFDMSARSVHLRGDCGKIQVSAKAAAERTGIGGQTHVCTQKDIDGEGRQSGTASP
jgi:hypothetical protein